MTAPIAAIPPHVVRMLEFADLEEKHGFIEMAIALRDLVAERNRLHAIACDCLAALGTSAGAGPEASIDFLANAPREVAGVVKGLRADLEKARNPNGWGSNEIPD